MTPALLITRPKHDIGTNYLFYWSQEVIAYPRGFKILDLKDTKANQKNVMNYIGKHQPSIVFFNGHGSENTISGYNNETLIEIDKNDDILAGAIVYARCCDAAKSLGFSCIRKGTRAFIGYKRKYILGYSPLHISRPLQDPVAKLFLEPSNLIPISLLKGNTVEMAYKKSQRAMLKNTQFMATSASDTQRDAAPYLWANRECQTFVGDQTARA